MVSQGPIRVTLPQDLSNLVRQRMAMGGLNSPEDVLRAALALLSLDQSGDDAATIRAKIEAGWEQSRQPGLIDGEAARRRWKSREGRGEPE